MPLYRVAPAILLAVIVYTGWPLDGVHTISRSPVAPMASDSIAIDVTNNMPHPMTLSYDTEDGRKPLGVVNGAGERIVVLHDLHGDSVTVWASNGLPPHNLSQTFPTHATATLTWAF